MLAGTAACYRTRAVTPAPEPLADAGQAVIDDSPIIALREDVQRQLLMAFAGTVALSLAAAGAAGRIAAGAPLRALSHRTARLEATGDAARKANHDIKNGLIPIRNVLRHLAQTADKQPAQLAATYSERRGTLESSVAYLDSLAREPRSAPAPAAASDARAVVMDVAGGVTEALVGLRMPATLPPVCIDAMSLRRVMENLVTNAVESFEGRLGTIIISADVIGIGRNWRVRIRVADTGRGMGRNELSHAFDDAFTTKPHGTGLGLGTVRRLLADAGGSVHGESTPGEGTTFTIEVPAVHDAGRTRA